MKRYKGDLTEDPEGEYIALRDITAALRLHPRTQDRKIIFLGKKLWTYQSKEGKKLFAQGVTVIGLRLYKRPALRLLSADGKKFDAWPHDCFSTEEEATESKR